MTLFKATAQIHCKRHKSGLIETEWKGGRMAMISQVLLAELQAHHGVAGRKHIFMLGELRVHVLPWWMAEYGSAFANLFMMKDGILADILCLYQRMIMWLIYHSFNLELYLWMFILCASKDYLLDKHAELPHNTLWIRRKVSDFLLGDGSTRYID